MAWEKWTGGRVWVAADGRRTFYGMVGGRMISTRRDNEADALAELMRQNLAAGSPRALPLDQGHINAYVQECRDRGLERANCNQKQRHLEEWAGLVGPRFPSLKLLNDLSRRMSGRRGKIANLKAYFTWLRQNGHIRRQEDPTLDLKKPEAPSRDWDRVIPRESHKAVLEELDQRWADLLTVLAATGWHVTELNRFARSGAVSGDVLVCPRHKSGDPHRTRVSKAALEAATRTLEAGSFSPSAFYREIAEACDRAEVPRFQPGGYRHTVATNAVMSGATPEAVAHFLGHRGSYMVKKIYAKAAVPAMVPTLV